ncbi:hypothetical protein, partial [Comamonas sp.]|uniref:hypothetical protein n=1 Tax=Comamonas sp. TaxID=34028 RepID=UPI002FCC0168
RHSVCIHTIKQRHSYAIQNGQQRPFHPTLNQRLAVKTRCEASDSTGVRQGQAATYPGWC